MPGHTIRARVTKAAVDRLQVGETLRDTELKGFGVRRQSDVPSYFLLKRVNGRLRWMTIGTHGSPWTPETARKEALRLMAAIASGGDPPSQKRHRLDNPTVAQAAKLFLAEHGTRLKPRTLEKYELVLRLHLLPVFGTRRIMDLKRQDVLQIHAKMSAKSSTANYAVAVLSKLLSWAEDHGLRSAHSNPCVRIKKYRETKRDRFLSREELGRLGAVLTKTGSESQESMFVVAALRLLLLTGARLNEILTLRWSYVDLDRAILSLPDSKTGQKYIFLNAVAIGVLKELPRLANNPYVIVGRIQGAHLINLQKPWRRIRAQAGLDDVRIHDLRHSFASIAAASHGSLPMIGRLLGHKNTETTARYAHLVDDPVRALNEEVGATIASAIQCDC